MNAVYNRYIKEGYQTTGIVSRGSWDKDETVTRAAEYRVMGNKVVVVQKTEVSSFRHVDHKNTYWVVLVKYSEKYLAAKKAERERLAVEHHESELRRMTANLSLEDIQFMLNYKVLEIKRGAS